MKNSNKYLILNMFVILLSIANLNASEVATEVTEADREYIERFNKSEETVEQKMSDLGRIESSKVFMATLHKDYKLVSEILRSIKGFPGSAMYSGETHDDYWVGMMDKFDDTHYYEILVRVKILNDPNFRAKLRTALDSRMAGTMSEVRKRVDSLIQAITYNWDPGLKARFSADVVMNHLKDNLFESFLNYLYSVQEGFHKRFKARDQNIKSDLPKLNPIGKSG